MKIVNCVGLYGGGVLPLKSKGAKAAFHCAKHIAYFLTQRFGADIAATHNMITIIGLTFGSFRAARNNERRFKIFYAFGIGESVE